MYSIAINNETKRVAVFCKYNIPCILGKTIRPNFEVNVFKQNTNISSGYFNCVSVSGNGQYQTTVQRTQDDNITCNMSTIFVSSDYGNTWLNVSNTNELIQNWTGVGVSDNGQYQIASFQPGFVYMSSNYGLNWMKTTAPEASWYGVAISGNGQYQLAVSNEYKSDINSNVYLSTNFGMSWESKLNSKLWLNCSISYNGNVMSAIAFSDANEVDEYGILPVGSIYVSNDLGKSWRSDPNIKDYFTSICVSSNGKYILVAANDCNYAPSLPRPLYLSSDYGASWTTINLYDAWLSVAISYDGKYQTATSYYQGTEFPETGFVYESNDYGQTWKKNTTAIQDEWTSISMSANGKIRTLVSTTCGNLYNSS
jgi:photosystem II stability/assembly factor-like uncharacterized protein